MDLGIINYNKELFIETASGNKVSRQSVLCGSQNIVLNGKAIVEKDVSFSIPFLRGRGMEKAIFN